MNNNVLISIFMGAKLRGGGKLVIFPDNKKCFTDKKHTTHNLEYDTNWNWLMPVVEKIESLLEFDKHREENLPPYRVDIQRDCVSYSKNCETLQRFWLGNYGTKMKATYSAVIDFIKWYNNVKSNREYCKDCGCILDTYDGEGYTCISCKN